MTKALVLASGLTFVLAGASFASSVNITAVSQSTTIAMDKVNQTSALESENDSWDDVSEGISPVPLPAAGWMLLAGLGGIVALRRRAKA